MDALIYNAGSGVWGHVEEVKAEDLERSWRVNTLGLFLSGREAIPAMRRKGQGAIIVVGATASRRGAAGAAAFAQSKMAQRALAESMARHLWPAGIHVALIVVDGVVGGPVTRARFQDRPDDFYIDPGRRRRDRRRPCQTRSLRLEFRSRGPAVQGKVVSAAQIDPMEVADAKNWESNMLFEVICFATSTASADGLQCGPSGAAGIRVKKVSALLTKLPSRSYDPIQGAVLSCC